METPATLLKEPTDLQIARCVEKGIGEHKKKVLNEQSATGLML